MQKTDEKMHDAADMQPKPVKDSVVVTRDIVHPSDVNAHGIVFGGYMMSLLDKAACIAAFTHAGKKVTTVAMDGIVFNSSMEIGLKVMGLDQLSSEGEQLICRAYMTFVAVDAEGHALAVAPVVPETPDEIRRYNEALVRREARIALSKSLTAR